MTFGEVYKKKSTWWYSKQSDNSDLFLSTKHRTQGNALKAAAVDLKEGQINRLYVYHGTGSLKEIMFYDSYLSEWKYMQSMRGSKIK